MISVQRNRPRNLYRVGKPKREFVLVSYKSWNFQCPSTKASAKRRIISADYKSTSHRIDSVQGRWRTRSVKASFQLSSKGKFQTFSERDRILNLNSRNNRTAQCYLQRSIARILSKRKRQKGTRDIKMIECVHWISFWLGSTTFETWNLKKKKTYFD